MLGSIEFFEQYFNLPTTILIMFAVIWLAMNVIGEMLEFKGKTVPEFIKIRKYFARKKKERETLEKMPDAINEMKKMFADFNGHYSKDNISARNNWINKVNNKLDDNERVIKEINKKLDENSEAIIALLVDNKRETIISFAEKVSDSNFPATREQFTRIDRIYQEYERIITERGLKNGEVDVAYRIIEEAYQTRLKNHTFIEDVRWHGLEKQ